MIRINLIPSKKKKKAKPVPKFLIALLVILAISIIGSVAAVNYFNGLIENLQTQKRDNQAKIAELKKKIKEVEGFEARNKTFLERKAIIEELTKNQSLPGKVLDELAARLTQGVWITSFSISLNKISLTGVGFSNNDIVDFVESLKASELFEAVALGGTTNVNVSGDNVYNFSLSMTIKA
jgi:type IV pilus assembly protein PilN